MWRKHWSILRVDQWGLCNLQMFIVLGWESTVINIFYILTGKPWWGHEGALLLCGWTPRPLLHESIIQVPTKWVPIWRTSTEELGEKSKGLRVWTYWYRLYIRVYALSTFLYSEFTRKEHFMIKYCLLIFNLWFNFCLQRNIWWRWVLWCGGGVW